jgi:hypothetical protein
VGPRHVFQAGGRGGTPPEDYLEQPHTPAPDDEAAESEWGLDPAFRDDVQAWCDERHGYAESGYVGPQAPAAAVATVMRSWYRAREEPANRLVVPCFILGDPWQTICAGAVPFWIHFAVQPALQALKEYLDKTEPYRDANVFLFEHGTRSPGIATPEEFQAIIGQRGGRVHLDGLNPERFPHDIGTPAIAPMPMRSWPDCQADGWTNKSSWSDLLRVAISVFPRGRAIHLAVVLRKVTLHSLHIGIGNVDATTSALQNPAG